MAIVDQVDGDLYIKLKKDSAGNHHWIPVSWVEKTDDKAVYLKKSEEEYQEGLFNEFPAGFQKRAS